MPRLAHALLAVCAIGPLLACADATGAIRPPDGMKPPERDDSPVQTDSLSYRLVRLPGEYRAYVIATYRNTTGAAVYFARCGNGATQPMFAMGRTGADSTRRFFIDWAWACVGGVLTGLIGPGQTVTVRAPFGTVDQPLLQPPLDPQDLVGTFRISLDLCARYSDDSDRCELLPENERRSNAFLIHY
jgi:hypothetical protein